MTKKRLGIIIFYLCLTVVTLSLLQKLLVPKYQTGIVEGKMASEYYENTEPHEVLFVGDCEVYENVSPITLYEEYGISSYIRGSAQQLTWQSYYLLEDALRYETPKVVIFNVLALKYDCPQNEAYNRMSIDGMRWSSSKVGAIVASMMEDEEMEDYLFPLLRYHSRWAELNSDDVNYMFDSYPVTHNGYYMRVDVKPESAFPPAQALMDYTLGENSMYWLDQMAQLCKENNITLILIKAPILYPYWYDQWDSQVEEYANTHSIPYINYIPLRDEIGLDMSVDTYDAGLHLNLSGAEKFSLYLGEYLDNNFDLTDYRVTEYAEIWNSKIDAYNEMREAQYAELEQYGELMSWGANAVN